MSNILLDIDDIRINEDTDPEGVHVYDEFGEIIMIPHRQYSRKLLVSIIDFSNRQLKRGYDMGQESVRKAINDILGVSGIERRLAEAERELRDISLD